jgi:uncharacterized protein
MIFPTLEGMFTTFPISASLILAVAVQIACQLFKVVFYSVKEKRLALSWFISAGGMPSAHSAFVTALSVSIGLRSGFASDTFTVACVFSVITIYDAVRLRGAVAHHARILERLLKKNPDIGEGRVNLHLGHTPLEILVGVIAGAGLVLAVWPFVGRL